MESFLLVRIETPNIGNAHELEFVESQNTPAEEAHRRQETAQRGRRVRCMWCKKIYTSEAAHFQVRGENF